MGNIIRSVIFIVAGIVMLLLPYEKFKAVFPKAASPVFVKVLGGFLILGGIVMLLLASELLI